MGSKPIRYSQKSVLIIEDFTEFARSLKGMMITMGSKKIDMVYNGEEAIQRCRERQYDIILSDYNLGNKKDGQQVLEELHRFNFLKSTCVFVMVTAENATAMVMGALEYQPDSYITKPFNGHVLQSRLDKLILKKDLMAPVLRKIKSKKWKEALELNEGVIAENPKYRMACLRQKFKCLKNLCEYQKALELTTEIAAERPLPWVLMGMGEAHFAKGDYQRALDVFTDMTKQFPMVPDGYDWLAKVQKKLGLAEAAMLTVVKAIEKSPKALARQICLGELAEENDDLDAMTRAFRQAVRLGQHSAFSSANEYVKLTKSLGRQLQENDDVDRKKLIEEVEKTFSGLNQRFNNDSTKLRSAVAHAEFAEIIEDKDGVEKYLSVANKVYESIDEQIGAKESVEMSKSLKSLGQQEFVENILKSAVEQYFDDPEFIEEASELTTNQDLILESKKANELNNEAIKLFKKQNFKGAIGFLKKAGEIAPSNINIKLNHAQALLKCYQAESYNQSYLEEAESRLKNVTGLAIDDSRYKRYSELSRLTNLFRQRTAEAS